MNAVEAVIVGAGPRAEAWRRALEAKALARISTDDSRAPVLVALPPRQALATAVRLAREGRRAVVSAPLDAAAAKLTDDFGDAVHVAHGWVTLLGWRWLEQFRQGRAQGRFTLEVAGLPDEPTGDLDEVLVHGLAAARRLDPALVVQGARVCDGGVEVELSSSSAERVLLRAFARGEQRFQLRAECGDLTALWTWRGQTETVSLERGGRATSPQTRVVPSADERVVRQLLDPKAPRGDTLADACAVMRLAEAVQHRLPHRLPLGLRHLRQAGELEKGGVPLSERIGLSVTQPLPGPVRRLQVRLPPEPLEVWSFRAGLKRAVFLTVEASAVDAALRPFGDVAVERLERRVEIGSQDTWRDDRLSGAPRVELYISRDAAVARRAAEIQARAPTEALAEMGELLGYPRCCVEAFAAQPDRSNNSWNRYATEARTVGRGPWPWELNNFLVMLLPYFPCRYDCPHALEQARATLAEMARVHPDILPSVRESLTAPVLYFDHRQRLLFRGSGNRSTLHFSVVSAPSDAPADIASLGGLLASGDTLLWDHDALRLSRGSDPAFTLERTDPGLGFIAPFGVT